MRIEPVGISAQANENSREEIGSDRERDRQQEFLMDALEGIQDEIRNQCTHIPDKIIPDELDEQPGSVVIMDRCIKCGQKIPEPLILEESKIN